MSSKSHLSSSSSSHHRHRSHSQLPSRENVCTYGSQHVKRSDYDEVKSDLAEANDRLTRKENELAVAKDKLFEDGNYWEKEVQTREDKLASLEASLEHLKKNHKDCEKDYNELHEDYLYNARAADENLEALHKCEEKLKEAENREKEARDSLKVISEEKRDLERNLQAEKKKSTDLSARVADLLKRPATEDFEEQATKLVKLEEANKTLSVRFDELAQARNLALDAAQQAKVDLEPIISLHPQLRRLSAPSLSQLATALVENLLTDLNEVWQYLPQEELPALITPQTLSVQPVVDRLKKGIRKAFDSDREESKKARISVLNLQTQIGQKEAELRAFKEAARDAANAAAHRQDQPTPTPDQLRQIVRGLAKREARADLLAAENQAEIFSWENVGLRIIPDESDIPPTVEQVTQRVYQIHQEWKKLQEEKLQAESELEHFGETVSLLKGIIREFFYDGN